MSDEIAQVVELECKGTYYLIKGTKEMIAFAAKFLVNLGKWGVDKWEHRQGNVDWDTLQKVSNGTPPILEFPKEMFEETIVDGEGKISPFESYCKLHNLQYCIMPDLNPYDDYIPVAVKAQDMGVHQEQIKSVMSIRIQNEKDKDKDYDEAIEKAKAKIDNAKSDEECKEAEKELAALLEAKAQNKELLDESENKLKHDNVIEFTEYLKQGEGTLLSTNMEAGFDQIKTCSLVKEFMPYECMYPIRDKALVPDSKEIYYSQVAKDNSVYEIRREFELDEQGLVYSVYHVTSGENGEKEVIFSDKGFSKEGWEAQLPELLKESGLEAGAPTAAIHGRDRMYAYRSSLMENFKKAREVEEQAGSQLSSKEVTEMVSTAKRDRDLRENYNASQYTTFVVPAVAVMPSGEQIISLELKEGLVEGITLEKMDSETAVVSIKEDETYRLERPDGSYKEVTGTEVLSEVNAKSEAVQAHSQSRARK